MTDTSDYELLGRFREWVTLRMLLVALRVYHSHREHAPGCMCLLRLEIELGERGDHDRPYDGHLTSSNSKILAWPTLFTRRECGELLP